MKELLTSEIVQIRVSAQLINESKLQNNGRLILRGVILQRANAKNANGRIYPKRVLLREATKYQKNCISINNAIGELDHPESSTVSLAHGALNVIKMWWEGDDLKGDVEVLTNLPNGQILEGYLKHGITVGISSRGLGSVKESANNTVEVQDDFDLVSFDAVSIPSTQGAYMRLTEGKNMNAVNEYTKALETLNQLIDEIIF